MHLPVFNNEQPRISGTAERMVELLQPVNSDAIRARIGQEKLRFSNDDLSITDGQEFKNQSATVRGRRYLYKDESGQFIACALVSRINGKAVLANLFVESGSRRQGIATRLLQRVVTDFPRLAVDSTMTLDGAAFFGYSEENDLSEIASTKSTSRRVRP